VTAIAAHLPMAAIYDGIAFETSEQARA